VAEPPTAKLAVILHADVVGSTALVQRDERIAHDRIQDAFQRFSQTIERYGGVPHEIRGDALLAECNRASDAVSAALAFQAANTEHNNTLHDEIRPEVRIGISLGEVVVADGTLTGPDVVLAQRLEQLAEPGGVCISVEVQHALPGRLPFEFGNLGDQEVKGFDEPVRAYAVTLKSGENIPAPAPPAHVEKPSQGVSRQFATAGIIAVSLVVAGVVAWWRPWAPDVEPASVERMVYPLPDKPSIAVLPFSNMSDDAQQEYFVDGMTEDLITDISKLSGLFVIARNSVFKYKGQSIEVAQVAEELGVRYVLDGSVRRSGDEVRINVQLIDATTGGHLWADRYDGKLDDVFGLQDKVAGKIVTFLAVQLSGAEQERVARKGTDNVQAYDAFLRGWQHYLRQTPEDFRRAVADFERAVELDPQYAHAHAALAATNWETWKRFWQSPLGFTDGSHGPRVRAEQLLLKAMQDPSPLAHQVASAMLLHQQQYEAAIAEARNAIELDPNDADNYIALANALTLSGEAEEAIEWVERAMRLNPHYPAFYLYQLGLVQFAMGEFAQAATSLEKAVALNPNDLWAYRVLIASYGASNRIEDAARAVAAMKRADTRGYLNSFDPLTIRTSAFWLPFKESADAERLARGLRNAGVPD
jgi:TolB-like protein/class 3 adenylate cyclase